MPSTIILEMNNIDYHTYVHPSGNSRLILNNEEEPDAGDNIISQKNNRNILAQYYIAAESVAHTESWNLFPPLDPLIQRPRLPDFPPGSVSVGNMRADTISDHFHNFHLQPTSYNTTRLLTNPKFRMLFQNILQEPTNIVLNTMILFQKEIDRMFFRIAAKEYTGIESIGIEAIRKQDMPYRSMDFAKNLYTICDEINKTTPYSWIHRSYIENIIRTEGHQITIENKYYAKKERCRERGLNFAQVINLWHCEHPHLLISLEESPYEWL